VRSSAPSRKLREAEAARDQAADVLDAALAREGWDRLRGALNPGTRLYTSVLYPGTTLPRDELLAQLERMRAVAR
jgi:hypothetical protein